MNSGVTLLSLKPMGSLWTTNGYSLGYHPRGTTLVYWICSLRFPIWGMNHLGKGSLYNCYVWLCLKLGYPKWWSITKFPAQIAMFRDRIFSDRSIPCFKRNYIKLLDQIWWIITYPFLSAYSAYSHVLLFQKHSSKIAQTGKKNITSTSPQKKHGARHLQDIIFILWRLTDHYGHIKTSTAEVPFRGSDQNMSWKNVDFGHQTWSFNKTKSLVF